MKRALLLLSLLVSMTAQAITDQEWNFRVFLEDREIGTHVFRVVDANGERRVESDAQFTVKILFIDAYTYNHRARERWNGECLMALDAATNDNGEELRVRGTRNGSGFKVEAPRGNTDLPACVMTFAYWNPAMLQQPRLLNVQTGEWLDVRVEAVGEETIPVRGTPVTARRYALHNPKFRIDLWYLANRQWVQLESTTESGRRLRYQIQ
jgi:hypothetical protein